jgi:ATP-dependent Clp protease ATP-binding subunit ClpA
MDNASLTDNNGVKADFRNVILIMTSNVGAAEGNVMGFQSIQANRSDEAVKRYFTPEFRNRLDAIVQFAPLAEEVMVDIVNKFVDEIELQLEERQVTIQLDDAAKEYLAREGYSPEFGARPLGLVLQEKLKDPISDEILFGKLEKGGKVIVTCRDDALHFEYEPKQ